MSSVIITGVAKESKERRMRPNPRSIVRVTLEPTFSNDRSLVGTVDTSEWALIQNAWRVLASATPVLAFPNGAAPEIVDPGRTGFLCRDEAEMVRAVGQVQPLVGDRTGGGDADEVRAIEEPTLGEVIA